MLDSLSVKKKKKETIRVLYLTKLYYYNQVYFSFPLFGSVVLPAALIRRGFGGAQVYTLWSEGSVAQVQTVRAHT